MYTAVRRFVPLAALILAACASTTVPKPSPAALALQGRTWTLSEAVDAKGARIAALLDKSGRPLALTFGPEEIAVLNACNHVGGTYAVPSAGRIRIGEVVSTLMACPETDLMEAERVIGAWLPTAHRLQVQDKRLELTAADGSRLVFVSR